MQNQIPNNWQKVKLGEVAEDVRDLYEPSKTENLNYIGLEHIDQGTLRLNEIGKSSEIKSSKKIFKENDILFGTLRSYFRKVVKPQFSGVCSTDIAVIRAKENNDQNFLFYFIANPYFVNFASLPGEGTKMPRAKWSYLSKTEWTIPKLEEQKRISSILSSFDDKIEMNNKIAKTLEDMASEIFKEWFVKFRFPGWEKTEFVDSELGKIPKGWEVIKLEKILKLKHGYAFKGNKFINEKTNNIVVRMGNFQENNGLQFLNNTVYLKNIDSQNKYLLNPGDIVMILSDITREGRLIGNVGIIPNDEKSYFLNQRVAKIETDKKYILYLLNLFTSKEFHQHCLSRADSATVLNLKNEHIHDYEIALPENNIFKKFDELIEPIMNKKEHIKYENQKLAQMRDLLLPKLMKGEIRIQ